MTAPPQNLEAEEHVLGAILVSPAALEACSETLTPSDFYRPSHGLIFRTALDLQERSESVDAITLVDALERDGNLVDAGGRSRLHELAAMVPSSANAAHHARIVRDHAGYRALLAAGNRITRLALDRQGELDELMAQAEDAMSGAVNRTITTGFTSIAEDLTAVADEIDAAIAAGQPIWGLKTGFIDLDNQLLGLHPGQLILIAARPAMGKSALAQNVAENVADDGTPAALVSLEMSKKELVLRSLSRAGRLDGRKLRQGRLADGELDRYREAKAAVMGRRGTLFLEDATDITPTTLRAQIRRLHRRHKLGLIVVDYLQLMLSSRNEESRQQEIAAISRSLKLLAKDLAIPIVALSQLNRGLELRQEKRPQLADLRDSGALEQDADVVLFIYRDDYYKPDSTAQGVAEVIVAKNRMGSTGTVKLTFTARSTSFKNLAQGVAPQ